MLARGECTFAPSPVAPRLGGAPSSRGDRTARPAPPPAPRPVRRLAPQRGRRGRAPGPQEGGAPCRLARPPTRSGAQRRALCKRMEKGGTRLLHIADIIRRAEGGQHEAGGGCPATPRPTLPVLGALSLGLAAATTSQRRFGGASARDRSCRTADGGAGDALVRRRRRLRHAGVARPPYGVRR